MTEFGQGTTPQTNHQYMAGVWHEQEEGHHLAGVGKIEVERVVKTHGTLDEHPLKIELPRAAIVDNEGFVVPASHHPFVEAPGIRLHEFELA